MLIRRVIEEHGYIPHVKGRGQKAQALKRAPEKKARRWIVELAQSGFNRFRKLLVQYAKLDCSCLALNQLAALSYAFSLSSVVAYCELVSRQGYKVSLQFGPRRPLSTR